MPSVKIIPAGKLVNIQCKLNLGDTTSKVPMLFEIEEIELPERLETISTIVSVKSGPKHRLKVPTRSMTLLHKKTQLLEDFTRYFTAHLFKKNKKSLQSQQFTHNQRTHRNNNKRTATASASRTGHQRTPNESMRRN